MKTCRLIARICAFYGGLFAVIFTSVVVFAAPPGSQPPSVQMQPAISFPDIKITDFALDRMNPKAGDIVFLKGVYLVTGCIKKPFYGKITLDGITLIEQVMQNYDPTCEHGAMWDANFGVSWKATPGTHTAVFTVDSKNDIYEGPVNEHNNTRTITFTVPIPTIDTIRDIKTKQPIPVPVPRAR